LTDAVKNAMTFFDFFFFDAWSRISTEVSLCRNIHIWKMRN